MRRDGAEESLTMKGTIKSLGTAKMWINSALSEAKRKSPSEAFILKRIALAKEDLDWAERVLNERNSIKADR